MPRASSYTDAIADEICSLIASGENLHRITSREGFPSRDCVYRWFKERPAFYDNYERARMARGDVRADRIDQYVEKLITGEIDANTARVAIDAEKWQAGKENPKRYGDNATIQHEHSGSVDLVGRLAAGRQRIAQIQRGDVRQIEGVVEAEVIKE